MIYLDNAATTMMKPECVVRAVADAMTSFGGVGRGVHPASIAADMAVYRARAAVANLLGAPGASSVGVHEQCHHGAQYRHRWLARSGPEGAHYGRIAQFGAAPVVPPARYGWLLG